MHSFPKTINFQNVLEATSCNLGKEDNHLLDGKINIFNTNFTKVTITRPESLCKLNLKTCKKQSKVYGKQNGIK